MAQGKVEICGVNTARLPLLGSAEQELLLKEIKKGNENKKKFNYFQKRYCFF